MKKIVFVNGIIAALLISGISSLMLWSAGPESSHSQSEWLGYLIMIVGLSVIFIAVKQHRDHHLGGVIGFKTAFMVGLWVTLIASACYVISWELYYQNAGQDFMAAYQESHLAKMRDDGATAAAIESFQQEMADFAALYAKFYFRAFITLIEILPVGLIISLLSASLLRTQSKH